MYDGDRGLSIIIDRSSISRGFIDPNLAKRRILRLIKEYSDKIIPEYRDRDVNKLIDYYNSLERIGRLDVGERVYSYLSPLEDPGSYSIPDYDKISSIQSINRFRDMFGEYSFAAYDSSWHRGGTHFMIDIVVINTGYYYYRYRDGGGGSGCRPIIFSGNIDDLDIEVALKEHEYGLARDLASILSDKYRFIFLDESLNIIYTVKWSREKRDKYISLLESILDMLVNEYGVIPLGVFYTKAKDIYRLLGYLGYNDIPPIQDKHLFNILLRDGDRSPIFRVHNSVLDNSGLDIISFYVKISRGNVLRVEFPSNILGRVGIDVIHRAVLLESIKGNGYPYILHRAHEYAVLSYIDRDEIEDYIARLMGVPPQYLYSMKNILKWRSIL